MKLDRNAETSISENRSAFKKSESKYNLVLHVFDTDHLADFDNLVVLFTDCNNYEQKFSLKTGSPIFIYPLSIAHVLCLLYTMC